MSQQTKTIPWINNVKALSIIAVFFVHCELYYGFTLDAANLFIHPWYVNAFFFVSGYLLFWKQLTVPKILEDRRRYVAISKEHRVQNCHSIRYLLTDRILAKQLDSRT